MLQSVNYNLLNFAEVPDQTEFFKETLDEISKIRTMCSSIKLLFGLPSDRVKIFVAEGERIYKIVLITPDVKKIPICWFVYLPLQRRLDLYKSEEPDYPFIQWKEKKEVFNNGSMILNYLKFSKLFDKVVLAS